MVKKAGTCTRSTDQVDVLHLMNQQIMQGITHLNNLAPSAADQRRIQLEGAISSALNQMAQDTTLGMSTVAIARWIELLENKLNTHIDSVFLVEHAVSLHGQCVFHLAHDRIPLHCIIIIYQII